MTTQTPTAYIASLQGHDIYRTRRLTGKTLAGIKRAATREFGAGFQHHTIIIWDLAGFRVSERKIGERRWSDAARSPLHPFPAGA